MNPELATGCDLTAAVHDLLAPGSVRAAVAIALGGADTSAEITRAGLPRRRSTGRRSPGAESLFAGIGNVYVVIARSETRKYAPDLKAEPGPWVVAEERNIRHSGTVAVSVGGGAMLLSSVGIIIAA